MKTEPELNEAGLPEGYPFDPGWEVTPRDAQKMSAADEGAVLIDVRTPAELATASIDGAVELPMALVPSRYEELRAHGDKRLIVFCHHGGRSMKVVQFLRQQGFTGAYSMAGGIDVWSRDIDQDVPRY